jgi:hypothetical protein
MQFFYVLKNKIDAALSSTSSSGGGISLHSGECDREQGRDDFQKKRIQKRKCFMSSQLSYAGFI